MDKFRDVIGKLKVGEEHELEDGLRRASAAVATRSVTYVLVAVVYVGFLVWAYRRIARENRIREAAVLESVRQRELLATTLASIGDGVIVADTAGAVTFLNAEAERLTGWNQAEAAGQPLSMVFRIVNEETRQTVENPVEKALRFGCVVGLANHTL